MEVKHSFLVETCLLTHGLRSIADDEILSAWPDGLSCITWVDEGSIRIGSAAEYILFRRRCRELDFGRIDSEGLEEALSSGGSGALTASGTMAVCERLGVPLAVTCGVGGICDIKGEELCPDLPALRDIPVSLIATAPKDMLDIEATLRWLADNGVRVIGADSSRCTGYIFNSADVPLQGRLDGGLPSARGRLLILNGIPAGERIQDASMIRLGIAAGKRAEAAGGIYHPAANAEFDRLTGGESSRIQLRSIIANAMLARHLTE